MDSTLEINARCVELGKSLDLKGSELIKYVNDSVKQHLERNNRLYEREIKKREDERKHELEVLRLQNAAPANVTPPRTLVKLARFLEGDDVDLFLQTYERVSRANSWSEEIGLSALQNSFAGTSVARLINALPPNTTYVSVKKEILNTFSLTVYDYQIKFRKYRQGKESFRQFNATLNHYIDRWFELSNLEPTFDNLKTLIVKEQWLSSVSPSLADYLKENQLYHKSTEDMIQLADNFQSIHKSVPNSFSRTTSRANNCFSNGKPNVNKFPSQQVATCYRCQKKGHIARNCQAKLASHVNFVKEYFSKPAIKLPVLSLCKSDVSVDQSLPVIFGEVNDKPVKILRDSGSTLVVCRKSLIMPHQFTNESVELVFANGKTAIAPKAEINLKCSLFTGITDVACIEDVPFDILLGNIPNALCPCKVKDEQPNIKFSVNAVQTRQGKIRDRKPEPPLKPGNIVQFDVANVNTQELAALQRSDATLSPCWRKTEQVSDSFPKYMFHNDVLIRKWFKNRNPNDVYTQIVLPEALRERVMKLSHDSIWSGHLGIKKTQDRITQHFFWPGCFSDIKRFCLSCPLCQKVVSQRKCKVPLVSMPIIGKPFHRIAIDFIGPLPKSSRGNRYALVAVDLATKYPDAVPLKTIDADRTAEALMEIFSRVGIPAEILHDQGSNFMSSVMRKFNQLLQIKSIRTSPYHGQGNGCCEKFNGTLKQMLKKVSNKEPMNWDRYLCPILFAYREVPQSSTGFSPFELLFGHEVRGPLFLIKEHLLDNVDNDQTFVVDYVLKMREQMRDLVSLANANEKLSKRKQKFYYDKSTRSSKLKPGDKVLILLPSDSNKLLAEWTGPFEVLERINKVDYSIKVRNHVKTFHINMLKLYVERSPKPNHVNFVNVCNECKNGCICDVHTEITLDDKLLEEISVITNEEDANEYQINDKLPDEAIYKISKVLDANSSVFSSSPGRTTLINYEIKLEPNVKPIHKIPYHVPFHLRDAVNEEIQQMLNNGIIRRSSSPWAFPVVVVKSRDSKLRITIDYRDLNKHVINDPYPMPSIDSVIEKIGTAKFISKIDLTRAFWQIPLTENCRKYTAFVTENGQYEFNVLPFGISLATAVCNRLIRGLLEHLLSNVQGKPFVESFVDDIVIYSNTLDEHLGHIDLVMSELNNAGFKIKISKCFFACNEIKLLGFVIGNGEVTTDNEKISAITKFPIPNVKKDMPAFLGLIGFYRRFFAKCCKKTGVFN